MNQKAKFVLLWTAAAILIAVHAGAAEKPDVSDILAKHAEAVGGEAAAKVESLKITGTYNFNGIDSPYTVYRQRPNLFRFEAETSRGTVVTAFDGKVAWSRSLDRSGEMRIEEMAADDGQRFAEENADFDSLLVGVEKKGHKVELVGTEDIDGVATYHLKVSLASGNVQEWFLSQDDHTAVQKITTAVHRRAGPYQRVWFLMEYQGDGGVNMPYYVEREDRQHVRAYTVEKVEAGVEIDPSLFTMPASAP